MDWKVCLLKVPCNYSYPNPLLIPSLPQDWLTKAGKTSLKATQSVQARLGTAVASLLAAKCSIMADLVTVTHLM